MYDTHAVFFKDLKRTLKTVNHTFFTRANIRLCLQMPLINTVTIKSLDNF